MTQTDFSRRHFLFGAAALACASRARAATTDESPDGFTAKAGASNRAFLGFPATPVTSVEDSESFALQEDLILESTALKNEIEPLLKYPTKASDRQRDFLRLISYVKGYPIMHPDEDKMDVFLTQLTLVNAWVNLTVAYNNEEASRLWRQDAKYTPLLKVLTQRSGVCKEMAELKYVALSLAGIDMSKIRLALEDVYRSDKTGAYGELLPLMEDHKDPVTKNTVSEQSSHMVVYARLAKDVYVTLNLINTDDFKPNHFSRSPIIAMLQEAASITSVQEHLNVKRDPNEDVFLPSFLFNEKRADLIQAYERYTYIPAVSEAAKAEISISTDLPDKIFRDPIFWKVMRPAFAARGITFPQDVDRVAPPQGHSPHLRSPRPSL